MPATVYIPRSPATRIAARRVSGLGNMGLGRMGDACSIAAALTPQFSNDAIASAFNALVQTFNDEQGEYSSMVQWLNQNGSTLTPEGRQAAIAALQQKTEALKGLQDNVATARDIVACLGITGASQIPWLSTYGSLQGVRSMPRLGLWPAIAVGVVASVLTAMGIYAAIKYFEGQADQAKANFQAAQNMRDVQNTAAQCLQSGHCTATEYNAMLAAGAASAPCPKGYTRDDKGSCSPSGLSQIPWTTIALAAVGVVAFKTFFGD